MLTELTATFSLLKTASELIKGFNSMQNKMAIGDIKIELNNIILDLQSNASSLNEKYNSLVNSKNDLEKEIANLKDFKSQKEKYILKEIFVGIHAYVPKEEKDRISKYHWLCQNCLDNLQKFSVYQRKHEHYYTCPHCKNKITPEDTKPIPEVVFRP